MFSSFGQETKKQKQIIIHFILNGYPEKLFTHTFNKSLTRTQAQELCETYWANGKRAFRFFSLEGVQIIDQQLEYVRNGQRIYVSRGQDFDSQRNFGQYMLQKPLGEGGFGRVWLAKSSITQELAAIKLIKLQKITGAKDIDMVFRQVENLKALSHPNIVKIINSYTLSNMQLVVVMEYLSGGELRSLLKQKTKFTQDQARRIFIQIIAAVAYCHRQNIIHRDLKLQNILVADRQTLKVKVADFGISGVADTFNPEIDIGTLRYMAPQVLSKKQKINTSSVDVWACGIMLFCMIYGHLPFVGSTNSQTIQAIVNGEFQFPPRPLVTQNCKNIILSALKTDPKKRISAGDLQFHPWITCDLHIQTLPQISVEIPRQKINSRQFRRMEQLKKIAIIPKRLQKQKNQVLQQLKKLASKRNVNKSQVKPMKIGSYQALSPHYKLPIKGKQGEFQAKQRKRVSLVHGLWK